MSKPITIQELEVLTNQVQLSGNIIKSINDALELNAKTYGYIGAEIMFLPLVGQNHNHIIRSSITKQVQILYNEFTVSHDTASLFIRYNN